MNKAQKKKLDKIWSILEEVIEQEQEAFDNTPESIQLSEKGEAMEENIDTLTDARDLILEVFVK